MNKLGISNTHCKKMVLTEADFLAEVQSFIKNIGLKMYKELFINHPTVLNSFKKICLMPCRFYPLTFLKIDFLDLRSPW